MHKVQLRFAAIAAVLSFTGSLNGGMINGAMAQSAAPAAAAPEDAWKFSYNIGATSDYIFRGFSQAKRGPAVQGGIDGTYGSFYVGAWASTVKFNNATDPFVGQAFTAPVELDVYGGIKPVWKTALGDFNFDLGAILYSYPGGRSPNANLNYVEGKVGVSKELWKDGTLSQTFFYSPTYQLNTGRVWTSETSFTQALSAIGKVVPSVSVLYGYQAGNALAYKAAFSNGEKSYSYWNGGVTFTYDEKLSLDLRYWDTNIKDNNVSGGGGTGFCTGAVFQCTSRAVATIKYTW
jgi:uncharacterized protein (TIGR02001 family)